MRISFTAQSAKLSGFTAADEISRMESSGIPQTKQKATGSRAAPRPLDVRCDEPSGFLSPRPQHLVRPLRAAAARLGVLNRFAELL